LWLRLGRAGKSVVEFKTEIFANSKEITRIVVQRAQRRENQEKVQVGENTLSILAGTMMPS
jgi:hypothetical protein